MKKHHENHKKQSLKKVIMFDHETHLDDFIIQKEKILNRNKLSMKEIVEMIPHQLEITKEMIEDSFRHMIQNFNFYGKVLSPLHNHKTFDNQMGRIEDMKEDIESLIEKI